LPSQARSAIAQHADQLDVAEGTELARQGDFAYEFFVIEEGSAEVLRDGEPIAELGAGDFLGEMGIVGKVVRNATVRTTSPARVIVMSEQDFRSMARTNPDVASRIQTAVEQRCQALV
jgi:CRP/FNR family cyclic AMP-dependent transcriptional regulator